MRKRFRDVEVLKGVELIIPAGRRLALVGPNGSGKSTLLRAVMGLVDCEGEVLLDGRAPFENRLELARRLAWVPQVAPHVSATVGEVLSLVAVTRGLAERAIADVARSFELDVASLEKRPMRALSGGMKQKLLVSIALAARPEVLVLDEPTASLDERAREKLFELCAPARLGPQTTLVVCSHRFEELRAWVDHVVALEDGRVRFDGLAADFPGVVQPLSAERSRRAVRHA